jgi:alpha-beta hydrolase superfamily lysophospholipase
VIDRFRQLPASLAERARTVRLAGSHVPGGVPALLLHPDWIGPAPTMIWLHGRTAYKEIDSGRFARWLRAGIAGVALDLPGHGEREDARAQAADRTLEVLRGAIGEIDAVVEALADPVWQGVFDLDRLGLGGMSLGGMATLRRLCEPHEFRCAAVECTSGDLDGLYNPRSGSHPWGVGFAGAEVEPLDPARHLEGFRPLPLLAMHSEADRIVPWGVQRAFLERLRGHYEERGADPSLVRWRTWPTTGAPEEHSGFGRVSNEAKNELTGFLVGELVGA